MTPTEKRAHHIKWLKFAILLSQVDFDKLTAGQRLDLKNDYLAFLDSGRKNPSELLIEVHDEKVGAPKAITKVKSQKDKKTYPEEVIAKNILHWELDGLTDRPDLELFSSRTIEARLVLHRSPDSFEFVMDSKNSPDQIYILLGYHLQGSGISASMLRRCPKCQSIFLANRKPRIDRELYCPAGCSGKAASNRYQVRRKELPRVKRLSLQGKGLDEIAGLTGLNTKLDREWLEKNLPAKGRRKTREK